MKFSLACDEPALLDPDDRSGAGPPIELKFDLISAGIAAGKLASANTGRACKRFSADAGAESHTSIIEQGFAAYRRK
jgi:hypothetical protein